MQTLADFIRDVPDFPKEGILFKDITTLLKDGEAFKMTAEALLSAAQKVKVDKVVGIESRGFLFGAILAQQLGVGFVPIRKPKKLPAATLSQSYALEYGMDSIEIHQDAISQGEKVLLHDDLLATGGTAKAACELIEKLGGEIVQISFIIELEFLQGRELLQHYPIESLIRYA